MESQAGKTIQHDRGDKIFKYAKKGVTKLLKYKNIFIKFIL